jgi:excisionase family DNA binding protein
METPVKTSPYLTYAEAAAYCRLDRTTLWRAVRAGDLRADGSGRAVRFHRKELDRFMQSQGSK